MWSVLLILQHCLLVTATISNYGAVEPTLVSSSTKSLSSKSLGGYDFALATSKATTNSQNVQSRNNITSTVNATGAVEQHSPPFPSDKANSGRLDWSRTKMTTVLLNKESFGPTPLPSADIKLGLYIIATNRYATNPIWAVRTISPDAPCSSEPDHRSLGPLYAQQASILSIPFLSASPTGSPDLPSPILRTSSGIVIPTSNALATDVSVACEQPGFGSNPSPLTASSNSNFVLSSSHISMALVSGSVSTPTSNSTSNSTLTVSFSSPKPSSAKLTTTTTSSSMNMTTFRTSRTTRTSTTTTITAPGSTSKTPAVLTAAEASTSDSSSNMISSIQNSSPLTLNKGAIAGIAIGSTAAVTLMVLIFNYLYRRRRRRKTQPNGVDHPPVPPLRPQRSKALFNCPEVVIYLDNQDDASSRYSSPPPTPPLPVQRERRRTRDPSPFADHLRSATPLSRESGSHLHSDLNMREALLRRNLPNIMTWDELVI